MRRKPAGQPVRWTEIVVAKPICTPARIIISAALDPYGVNYECNESIVLRQLNPLKLPKGTEPQTDDSPLCYVAHVRVKENAAQWAEYLLLRTHKFVLLSPPKNPRNAQWVARFNVGDMPKPWVEPGCKPPRPAAKQPAPEKQRGWLAHLFGRK